MMVNDVFCYILPSSWPHCWAQGQEALPLVAAGMLEEVQMNVLDLAFEAEPVAECWRKRVARGRRLR